MRLQLVRRIDGCSQWMHPKACNSWFILNLLFGILLIVPTSGVWMLSAVQWWPSLRRRPRSLYRLGFRLIFIVCCVTYRTPKFERNANLKHYFPELPGQHLSISNWSFTFRVTVAMQLVIFLRITVSPQLHLPQPQCGPLRTKITHVMIWCIFFHYLSLSFQERNLLKYLSP